MASLESASVVRQIGSLFEGGSVAGMSDRQLLDRFTAQRDAAAEAAFAALVTRHGPTVLGVCLQILGDRHHAEDAFQAIFLILARKARTIGDPDLLGNWLYGVSLRTCRCARIRLGRHRKNEKAGSHVAPASSASRTRQPSSRSWPASRPRCCTTRSSDCRERSGWRLFSVTLEGLTVHEAARRLRCSHGTVRSRMARARDKLRRGLIRRGVVLPAAALAAALAPRSASASVSPHLCEITTRAAVGFAAGQPPPAATGP